MTRRGRLVASAMLALVGSAVALNAPLRASPPGEISFQARLTDANGKPLADGTVSRVAFLIFADEACTQFAWGEAHVNVPISRGVVSVRLGAGSEHADQAGATVAPGANPLSPTLFDGSTKYVRIKVNAEPLLAERIHLVSVPYALSAGAVNGKSEDQIAAPIGAIVDWFRPSTSTPIPQGWRICDGGTVNDSQSPFNGRAVPNLVGRFVRGLDPALLTTYGADSAIPPPTGGAGSAVVNLGHAHSFSTPSHSHTIPAHVHTYSGSTSGPQGTSTVQFTHVQDSPLGINNHFHSYNGTTDAGGLGQTGDASGGGGTTSTALGTVAVATEPPYVGLLKIIRIK